MNDHRYIHFFAKNGEIELHQLPPCKVSLQRTPCGQTFKRVFGGAVCSVAHQSSTQLDSDGAWEAQRTTNQVCQLTGWIAAPEAVLELLACRCPRSCRLSDCACMANALTCTQTCVDCRTQAAQEDVEVIVDGDSEEEDEDGY